MSIETPYEKLFGFVPQPTRRRHKFSAEVFPEILGMQEEFRLRMMHTNALDEKTAQLILFGMLSASMREGAIVHAIAARKLGASWKELHAVSNLVYLFAGLSAMNFSIGILDQLKAEQERKENGE